MQLSLFYILRLRYMSCCSFAIWRWSSCTTYIYVVQLQILKLDACTALFLGYRCKTLTKSRNDLFQQRAQTPTVGLGAEFGHLISQLQLLFICGVNLRSYKIHKSCSTMSFIQQLFRCKTCTETGTSKESGGSDSCKVCLYGSMGSWGRAIGLVGLKSSLQTKRVCVSGWFHYWRQRNAPVINMFKKLLESKSRGNYT